MMARQMSRVEAAVLRIPSINVNVQYKEDQ